MKKEEGKGSFIPGGARCYGLARVVAAITELSCRRAARPWEGGRQVRLAGKRLGS